MIPKHRVFAEAYVRLGSALGAAKEAGYSEHYANNSASKILARADVSTEVRRLRTRLEQKADKTALDVVNEYSKMAFVDRVDFLKADPDFPGLHIFKSPEELTPEQRAIVEQVTPQWHTRERVIGEQKIVVHREEFKYMLSDKASALQQMGRHFGIFDDKLSLTSNQSNPFKTATPEQLERLRSSWIETMNRPLIEGTFEKVN